MQIAKTGVTLMIYAFFLIKNKVKADLQSVTTNKKIRLMNYNKELKSEED